MLQLTFVITVAKLVIVYNVLDKANIIVYHVIKQVTYLTKHV